MKPNNRRTLLDYCLRALGAPVIEINVDEDQLEDRLDEAIQFYQEFHSDATIQAFIKHEITQEDIDNKYIPLDDSVIFVNKIFPLNTSSSTSMFNFEYQFNLNEMPRILQSGGRGLSEYMQMQSYLELMRDSFNGDELIRYNRNMDILYLDTNWSEVSVGDVVIIDGKQYLDPDTYVDIYNDMYLKRYLTALIKRAWGLNLIKFEGMQLPGGVTLNGRATFDDANAEIVALEEQMRLVYEDPIDFIIG